MVFINLTSKKEGVKMDQEKIGNFIKKIREENHFTQKEFADKLGVTFQAVSKWENGKNIPDIAILKQISDEFHINIDEILSGERKDSTPQKSHIGIYILLGLLGIGLLIVGIITIQNKQNSTYEFKTISSQCSDFKITGSAAYNKKKATIYISNVEFCGEEDSTIYKKISCNLYENYNNVKTMISSCKSAKNKNLEEFLKTVNISVDHYSSNCKNLTTNTLFLEIQAVANDNKTITYSIPIKLNDTCK